MYILVNTQVKYGIIIKRYNISTNYSNGNVVLVALKKLYSFIQHYMFNYSLCFILIGMYCSMQL